jgi:hypothetical protein
MFHSIHVEVEEGVGGANQVSGIMTIMEGECSESMVVMELCALYEDNNIWVVKELQPGSFLVVFPDKEARRSLTRFKKGFYFVTAEVKANVVDSQRDADSFG